MIKKAVRMSKRQGLATSFRSSIYWAMAACLWLMSSVIEATQWHAHKDIYQAINDFSKQTLGGHALTTKLDERSRYPLCAYPLQVTLPFNNQKTVKVVCEQTQTDNKPSWSLYLSIKVKTNTQAWRLISNIAEQGTINASHVALAPYTGSSSRFIGSDTNPIGKQVKRPLDAGHWLSARDFSDLQNLWRAAKDITQGQIIRPIHLVASLETSRNSSPNALSNKNELLGQLAKRYIKAGKLLEKNDIEGQQYVAITNQALPMGRTLITEDILMTWVPDHALKEAGFNDKSTLVGWVTKRHIASSTPITKNMIRKAYLVIKGSQVSLQINLENYQITNQALALSNGNLGDEMDVKLTPSGMIKQGVVTAKGQLELSQ